MATVTIESLSDDVIAEVLGALQGVADDDDAQMVENLAVEAGLWWRCEGGAEVECRYINGRADAVCGACGAPKEA